MRRLQPDLAPALSLLTIKPVKRRRVADARLALFVAIAGVVSANTAFAQTAYFSTQGDFTTAGTNQLLYFDLNRAVTSAETLRFESFSSRGTTLNAAGDTSPTSPTGFDSVLDLVSPGGVQLASNDDGAAGTSRDALLTWPGIADEGGTLGAGPLTAGVDYRVRVREFDNETGPWGVDLVGPANAIVFRDFFPDQGAASPSNVRSIKFGTDGVAAVGSLEAHAIFKPTPAPTADYKLTGGLVVANTGNASFIMDSTDGDRFTVGSGMIVKAGGDVTLSGNATLNANGFIGIEGGRVSLSGTSRLNLTSFTNIDSGGRIDVNAGATLAAPTTLLGVGVGGTSAEAQLVVTNGTVTAQSVSTGTNVDKAGRVVVTGANGRLTLSNFLTVGNVGTAALEITAGGQITNLNGFVAFSTGSVGTANVSGAGSIWTSTGNLALGRSTNGGVGALTTSSGGRINVGDGAAAIPFDDYSYVDDTSANASDGGLLSVYNGSTLTLNSTGLVIGRLEGHSGRVLVSGAGSTVNAGFASYVGNFGSGVLDVLAGGNYRAGHVFLGLNFAGRGVATVDGANSRLTITDTVTVGNPTGDNAAASSITMANGGQLYVGDAAGDNVPNGIDISDLNPISANAGGLLTIRAGGTVTAPGNVLIGRENGASGRLVVTGNDSTLMSSGVVFVGNRGRGDARIEAGGDLVAGQLVIGAEDTGNGTMTVTGGGSTATAQFLDVGTGNTGLLTIASGGGVNVANDVHFGGFATGVGTITLSDAGSTLDVNGDMQVGIAGRGVVNLGGGSDILVGDAAAGTADFRIADSNLAGNAGGNVVLKNNSTWTMTQVVRIAEGLNTYGRLAVDSGSSFSTDAAILVGSLGIGVLDVTAGGRVTSNSPLNGTGLDVGLFSATAQGTVTVDGSGSMLDINNNVRIGNGTTPSTLTVRNGGQLLVGDVAGFAPASVRVHVADLTLSGDEGGIIDVRPGSLLDASDGDVRLGTLPSSFGRINLNGANARLLAANVVVGNFNGTGRLDVAGGTLTATGTVSIAGSVNSQLNLSGGSLVAPTINASGGGFNFTGGRLETTTYTGSLTQNGGTFAPDGLNNVNPTTLSGGYILNAGDVEIRLGNVNDSRIDADGAVQLNGGNLAVSVVDFVPTLGDNYTVIHGSSLTGHFATVTGVSISPNRSFAIIYDGTNVNYVVAIPGDATLSNGVEFNDLVAVAQNYGTTGRTWVTGDFNGTGAVDFDDLVILAQHYGQTSLGLPAGVSSDFAADWVLAQSLVPEPAAILVLPLLATVSRRRR